MKGHLKYNCCMSKQFQSWIERNYIWGANARSRRTHVLMFCNKHTPNEILP